ncbi:hypothetical protein IQ276_034930 [Desmonostoc muscorum LEGE 12446]|uniref:Uncharacterized protein n=1 Tax=Desmonostoc muscorum LEGE 12446 TaxID=1828758 RepID=A0A8J6ZML9_DESMC|nr:hypothetical protein [Desmonostoc muscorum]MCF2151516.1 hypothetical protein [Desmonostoc muscorum LEGE 12446]
MFLSLFLHIWDAPVKAAPLGRSLASKQYTGTMKIPDCDRCLFCAHDQK